MKDINSNFDTDTIFVTVNYGAFPKAHLLFPRDQALLPGSNVTLQWTYESPNQGDKIVYDLYLGQTENPPLYKAGLTDSELVVSILNRNKHYWHVQAGVGEHRGMISPTRSFSVEHPVPDFGINITITNYLKRIMPGQSLIFSILVENTALDVHDSIELEIDDPNLREEFILTATDIELPPRRAEELMVNITPRSKTLTGRFIIPITARSKGAMKYNLEVEDTAILHLTIINETNDLDGDNLPDSWEIDWFGDIQMYDGSIDVDNDGRTNLEEFNDNTNPNKQDKELKPGDNGNGNGGGEAEDGSGSIVEENLIYIILGPIIILILVILLILLLIRRKSGGKAENYNYIGPNENENYDDRMPGEKGY